MRVDVPGLLVVSCHSPAGMRKRPLLGYRLGQVACLGLVKHDVHILGVIRRAAHRSAETGRTRFFAGQANQGRIRPPAGIESVDRIGIQEKGIQQFDTARITRTDAKDDGFPIRVGFFQVDFLSRFLYRK